jgi:2-methylisocitrate lyase-like PEP mutase family enzyme
MHRRFGDTMTAFDTAPLTRPDAARQANQAAAFHALHRPDPGHPILVLSNVWDVGSARVVQSAGGGGLCKAIATSSAAVAWAQGYGDGQQLPEALLLATVAAIAHAIHLPLTVDIEAGGSDDPAHAAHLAAAVMQAGAVGINIEDGGGSAELLAQKISAIRQRCGAQLFINARCDVFIRNPVPAEQRVAEVLRRAVLYQAAGASGLFVPRVAQAAEIGALVAATALPVNMMAAPGLPDAAGLLALGVRRLSAGSCMAEALHGAMLGMSEAFLQTGQVPGLPFQALGYGALNAVMAR